MVPTGGLKVELIDREDALGPVLESWRRLAVARGNAFVTPDWYLTALRTLHAGDSPAVVVVRESDGGLRGLLPLLDIRRRGRRLAGFPGTRFGDLYHPVAHQDDDERVAAAAAPVLARYLGSRCQVDLGRVDAGARWWRELARAWPGRMTVVPHASEALPYIELGGLSWEEYLAGRSRQFRNQVGRKMRGLRRDHQVRVRKPTSDAEVLADIATLFELHEARWKGRHVVSSIADPEAHEFHREFVIAAHKRGWLRLYTLEVDEAPVAGWYGWRVGEVFSYYQAGIRSGLGSPQRRLPAARRDRPRGERRGGRHVRPAARGRGVQGALRNRHPSRADRTAGATAFGRTSQGQRPGVGGAGAGEDGAQLEREAAGRASLRRRRSQVTYHSPSRWVRSEELVASRAWISGSRTWMIGWRAKPTTARRRRSGPSR